MLKKTRHQSIPPISPGYRNDHVDQVGVPDRDLQDGAAAIAETQEIRLPDLEIPEQRGNIIRVLLKCLRAISIACSAMTLHFQRNYPSVSGH
jgi:hypothetical protein